MKIAFTGGGTGGHFYPIIAVVEAIEKIVEEKRLVSPELYLLGPKPFDPAALPEHDITHVPSPAGKMRQYASILNVLDWVKTFFGIIRASLQLFSLYPDVVFSTGGYAAFPTLFAARLWKIPTVIYDADATPGKVTRWSARFARWIAVAHPLAAERFSQKLQPRIAHTGHPIREEITAAAKEGAHEFLKIDSSVPTIFFMGGSQGARVINETLLNTLPDLVGKYNIIHQAGAAHVAEVSSLVDVVLRDSPHKERYRPFGLMNTFAMRMVAGVADLVVARAGSGTIFEVASWQIPAILIPLPLDVSRDQTENAYSYARAGGAVVVEERNFTQHVLIAEVQRLMSDGSIRSAMRTAAGTFATPDAAKKLAAIIMETALEHEPA